MNESTTLTLDETMRGFLAPVSIEFHKVSNPGKFKTAFTEGKMNDQQIDLKLKLCFPKSDDLLRNGETSAEVSGSVESHLLGKTCKIINGKASLFSPSPRSQTKREMKYVLDIMSPLYGALRLTGIKYLGEGKIWDLWSETTTLNIKIEQALAKRNGTERLQFAGIARVSFSDLLNHLTTIRGADCTTPQSIKNTSVFLGGFAKSCATTYLAPKPKEPMHKDLAEPLGSLNKYMDTVVIGSGYGGAISAFRLAQKGYEVAILERGKEFRPGDFPDTSISALKNIQLGNQGPARNRLGLLDIRTYNDAAIVVGCGLGGTSLINANVVVEASDNLFKHEAWPEAIRKEGNINRQYAVVRSVLGAQPYDEKRSGRIEKRDTFKSYAQEHKVPLSTPPLAVNFKVNGMNEHGAYQSPCISCGNCCSGCNIGAKNTLDKNYLPMAKNQGARIYTQIEVSHFKKLDNGHYQLYYWLNDKSIGSKRSAKDLKSIQCRQLVVAAGALGSPEIMLKSSRLGDMSFSPRLGKGFSLNGGTLGWIYNTDKKLNPIGFEKNARPEKRKSKRSRNQDFSSADRRRKASRLQFKKLSKKQYFLPKVGPTITSLLDYRYNQDGNTTGFVIEDASVPGVLAPLLPWGIMLSSFKFGKNPGDLKVKSLAPIAKSLIKGSYEGAINNSFALLGVGYEKQMGEVCLPQCETQEDTLNTRIELSWPSLKFSQWYDNINQEFANFQKYLGGIFVDYNGLGLDRPVSVHPLGSCGMGDSFEAAVVNHRCEVFSEDGGVHKNLYICDGSIIPCSVGTNPLLTISALTERAMEFVSEKKDLSIPKFDIYPQDSLEEFSKSKALENLARDSKHYLNSYFSSPIFETSEKTFGLAKTLSTDLTEHNQGHLKLQTISLSKSPKKAFLVILDHNHRINQFHNGPFGNMVQELLKEDFDVVLVETSMSETLRDAPEENSYDHVASDQIPFVFDYLKSQYSQITAMPLGLANIPFFLAYLSGILRPYPIHSIVSVACSIIPMLSEPWRRLNSFAGSKKISFKGLERFIIPKSFQRHLTKCLKNGFICRYHVRENDRFHNIASDCRSKIQTSYLPIMFLSGSHDRLFKNSQRQSYALFEKYSPTPVFFKSVPKYSYHMLLSSKTWREDVGQDIFRMISNEKSLREGKKAS